MMPQVDEIVGIDVSKRKLDWCIRGVANGIVVNTPGDCEALAEMLVGRGVTVAVMEASGGYERTAAAAMRNSGILARVVDPKRVRKFADAAGKHAKTDRIDAEMIAWYGATFPSDQQTLEDVDRAPLAALVGAREDLKDMRTQCLNRGEHGQTGLAEQVRKDLIEHLDQAMAKLDAAIAAEIEAQPRFSEDAAILTSTPGISLQATAGALAWLPELGQLKHEKIGALVGVVPYDDRSAGRDGARHIAGGRHRLRRLLYMATLGAATQHNPVLKAYYQRLRAKGKPAKVAIIACMHKLLIILNTMMAKRQHWHTPEPAVA
jgi:transposase